MSVRKLGNFIGTMVSIILESGKKIKKMELEYGNLNEEISIWASGLKEK